MPSDHQHRRFPIHSSRYPILFTYCVVKSNNKHALLSRVADAHARTVRECGFEPSSDYNRHVGRSVMDNDNVEYCSGKDYFDKFDPDICLRRHAHMENSRHMLRCYHDAFQSLPRGLSVLDYGSGPSVRGTISAATKASEIVLSYYSATNFRLAKD